MKHLQPASLANALDSLAEGLFFNTKISAAPRTASVKWIASRQGLPGAYAGMFAPTARDLRGIRLFTGETVRSRAGVGHLLSEEACRLLAALAPKDREVRATLHRAVEGMTARLDEFEHRGCTPGTYCCGTCTVGYWRNLANGLFPRAAERLPSGLAQLRQHRVGDGTWRRYPFFYTSLALTEIGPDLPEAKCTTPPRAGAGSCPGSNGRKAPSPAAASPSASACSTSAKTNMNRRSFLKDCLGGACVCAVASTAPALVAATDPAIPEDWRLPFIRARYAQLLQILSARQGDAEVDATLRELGRFCASGLSLLAKHRGHLEDFAREFGEKANESITINHARGLVTVVGPERPGCFCPLVDHRTCPKSVCSCSLGWQQQVYETLLDRPVEVRLVESVVRGGKRCVFEIRFKPVVAG